MRREHIRISLPETRAGNGKDRNLRGIDIDSITQKFIETFKDIEMCLHENNVTTVRTMKC